MAFFSYRPERRKAVEFYNGSGVIVGWQIRPITNASEALGFWTRLNEATLSTPALDVEIISALIDVFGNSTTHLALLGESDNPRAAAVLVPSGRGRWSTFHPSQATVGLWLQARDEPVDQLAQSLLASLPLSAGILELKHFDPALIARPNDSICCQTVDYIPTPRLIIDSDFETYWQARGKNLRSNVRKQTNRLAKESVEVSVEAVETPQGIADAVMSFSRLESAGWKGDLGSAVVAGGEQHEYYRRALSTMAARGRAMVFVMRYGDEIVAVDLCIKGYGTCVILKTTYDERITATSPAVLLRHRYFQSLFESNDVGRIEFYGRVMDWHTKWTNDIRTMYHLNVYRNRVVRAAHDAIRRLRTRTDVE